VYSGIMYSGIMKLARALAGINWKGYTRRTGAQD
jgi:hypothetical protein